MSVLVELRLQRLIRHELLGKHEVKNLHYLNVANICDKNRSAFKHSRFSSPDFGLNRSEYGRI